MEIKALTALCIGLLASVSATGDASSARTGVTDGPPVQSGGPQSVPDAEQQPMTPDVVVNGRLPHCRARPGEPLDDVDVSEQGAVRRQRTIAPDPHSGVLRMIRDNDPITGPDTWQRVGTGLDQYIFRAPSNGTPICIGARGKAPIGFGQLRRELNAKLLKGQYVRFTAWVATRHVGNVTFWVAIGDSRAVLIGQDSSAQPLQGDRSWTPVSLILGPIVPCATKLSYGLTLNGPGDVWLVKPALDVIPKPPDAPVLPKGQDPYCKAAAHARGE